MNDDACLNDDDLPFDCETATVKLSEVSHPRPCGEDPEPTGIMPGSLGPRDKPEDDYREITLGSSVSQRLLRNRLPTSDGASLVLDKPEDDYNDKGDHTCLAQKRRTIEPRLMAFRLACFAATSEGKWQRCLYGACRRFRCCKGGRRGTFLRLGKPICSLPLHSLPPYLDLDDGLDPFNPEGLSLESRGGVLTPKEAGLERLKKLKAGRQKSAKRRGKR